MSPQTASVASWPGSGGKAETILVGAMREFLANGYAATSMDRVAAAAGVSKATVYSHFRDKEGLFAALVDRLARDKFGGVLGAGDRTFAGEPADVLRRLVTTVLATIVDDPEFLAFLRLVIAESERMPAVARAFVLGFDKPIVDGLGRYLGSHPELGLADPEAVARVVLGTVLQQVIVQELLRGNEVLPMDRERLVDAIVTLIAER